MTHPGADCSTRSDSHAGESWRGQNVFEAGEDPFVGDVRMVDQDDVGLFYRHGQRGVVTQLHQQPYRYQGYWFAVRAHLADQGVGHQCRVLWLLGNLYRLDCDRIGSAGAQFGVRARPLRGPYADIRRG